jgi:hypothetical protein
MSGSLFVGWPLDVPHSGGSLDYSADSQCLREALWNVLMTNPGERAPLVDIPGFEAFDQATALPARTLNWSLVTQDSTGSIQTIALEVQADTSNGGRAAGVALLGLPSDPRRWSRRPRLTAAIPCSLARAVCRRSCLST